MATTLYYTFSTIAQTLAGAFGVLAAFLLYHLSQSDAKLRRHLETLYLKYPAATETVDLEFMWHKYDVPALLGYFEKDKYEVFQAGEGLDKALHLSPASELWNQRTKTLRQARNALVGTAGIVSLALISLACVELLAACAPLAVTSLIVLVGGAVGCLILYGQLILGTTAPS